MSISPSGPQEQPVEREPAAVPRWVSILFVILFALTAYLLYDGYTSRHALQKDLAQNSQKLDQLTAEVAKATSRITDLRGELDLTTQKLGLTENQLQEARKTAQSARKEQEAASKKLAQFQKESTTKMGEISTELGGAKTDIESTKKDLEATKGKLDRSMGDMGVMSGLIAHNRDELETLKRMGERNIYEFDLRKSKGPQRVGPIQVVLRKVDGKHYRYSIDVIADDRRVEKKDKTAGEPVQFIVRGARVPYEIVVFDLKKDEALGYLSTPKETGSTPPQTPASNP